MPNDHFYELDSSFIELVDSKIISIRYKEEVCVTLSDAVEILEVVTKLNPNSPNPCPRLIYYNPKMSFDFAAIRYLSKSKIISALAVVYIKKTSLPILNAILNLFNFFKIKYPIQFFLDDKKAKEWLLKHP